MSLELLPVWTELSIRNHFLADSKIKDYKSWSVGDSEWPMIFGGIYKEIPRVDHMELRFDGPFVNEVSRGIFDIETEINILVTAFQNETSSIKISQATGILLGAFSTIQIKKYTGDESVVGCLKLKNKVPPTKGDRLEIRRFQQIDKDQPIEQAIVEGHFMAQIELE